MMLRKIVSGIPIKTLPHTTGSPNPRQRWLKRVRRTGQRRNRSPLFKFKHSLLTCFTDAELSTMERASPPRHLFLGCRSNRLEVDRWQSATLVFFTCDQRKNSPRLEILPIESELKLFFFLNLSRSNSIKILSIEKLFFYLDKRRWKERSPGRLFPCSINVKKKRAKTLHANNSRYGRATR